MSNYTYGIHAVTSVLENNPERIKQLWVLEGREDKKIQHLLVLAQGAGLRPQIVSAKTLDKLLPDARHQGVIAQIPAQAVYTENDLPEILARAMPKPLFLVLDGVEDPHNLGACLRSADAAGVCAVIAPKDKAVGLTPVVRKVASGAAETVPFVQVTNLARTLAWLKEQGVWLYGLAGEAEQSLFQADLTGAAALVMGAEGAGLRRLTRDHCDYLIKIPMIGTIESLNVSVATGISLFEAVRQRQA